LSSINKEALLLAVGDHMRSEKLNVCSLSTRERAQSTALTIIC
jgi:hypothetical protein